MNKEEIEQRLKELKQEKKQLKKQLNELPSFEVGKWYNIKNGIAYLTYNSGLGYGVHCDEWRDELFVDEYTILSLATDKEVETALIKEAKRRGYKAGVKIKSFCPPTYAFNLNCRPIRMCFQHYNGGDDKALRMGGACIYSNGKWAEIIEQPKTVSLNGVYTKIQLTDIINNRFNDER